MRCTLRRRSFLRRTRRTLAVGFASLGALLMILIVVVLLVVSHHGWVG